MDWFSSATAPKDSIFLSVALAALIVLAGCTQNGRIEGDVFVVTAEQEIIKMGLVEVSAIEAAVMDSYLEERFNEAQQNVDSLMPRMQRFVQELDSLYGLQRTLGDVSLRQVGFSPNEEASVGDEVVVYASVNDVAFLNAGYGDGEIERVHDGERATVLDAARELPPLGPRYYKLDFGNQVGWLGANDIVLATDYDRRTRKRRIDTEILETKGSIEELKEETKEVRGEAYFFQELPSAAARDTTGSGGRYSLEVTPGAYYIIASSDRQVGDRRESYFWVVKARIGDGNRTLDLSNNNMGWLAQQKYALSQEQMNQFDANMLLAVQPVQELEPQEHVRAAYEAAFP